MFRLLKDIIGILNKEQRRVFYRLQFFVILTAIAEVLSLASIGPFMALVGNIELIESNRIVNSIYLYYDFNAPMRFLSVVGIIVLILLLFSTIVSIYTISKLSFFAAKVGAEIGDTLYAYYLSKDYLYHTQVNSSHLIKQIATEVSRVTDNVLQPLVQINARIVAVISISLAIFIYNPIVSIIGLIVLFIAYYFLFSLVKRKLEDNGVNITNVSIKRFSLMSEGFGSIRDVKILNRDKYFISQFEESGKVFSEAYGSSNALYNIPRYVMEFVVYSGMVILVLILLYNSNDGFSEILPVLAIFGMAAFKLLPSFQQIYSSTAQIKSNLAAFNAIKVDILESRINSKNNLIRIELKQKNNYLNLENICFKYPDNNEFALQGVNIFIPEKSVIGIVGPSGSGKSTLLDILLGLIQPSSGVFYYGNEEVRADSLESWQRKIGYVPQNIFIKDGSVIDNIAFGLLENQIDMEKVINAVEQAQLNEWILSLPDGLMTRLGERGVQISGGQKQRIGIARALYNNAEYLFFDEATSALDGRTEHLIMDAIENISETKTIVMIAHRINTVMKCDLIYIIESGRVVDKGTYSYLIENSSYFNKIATGNVNE